MPSAVINLLCGPNLNSQVMPAGVRLSAGTDLDEFTQSVNQKKADFNSWGKSHHAERNM